MLSERIKELRLARRLNQIELGYRLGVTKQSVSNWENGNILPSVDMLVRIADFFAVSTDYLLGLDDNKRIDITGLNDSQIDHIRLIIADITGKAT